ncbi:aminoglycoside phosphotransferase family protein [Pseudonocardia sp. TMWB2A]|uniref:phosphotransferase enzyme family protein n=1 Tax=Pseudonocardia sp. TMWB2A TaxID=687430 RepID=UPI00307D5EE3
MTHLDVRDAIMLRLGENAIFGLVPRGPVVRIARSMERWGDAEREVWASGWLASYGVRVCETVDMAQPIPVSGHPVTFWQYIDGRRGRPEDVYQLGTLLRNIHSLEQPVSANALLPRFDPLGRVAARIACAPICEADRISLSESLARISVEIEALEFQLPVTIIHGDAHVQNLMVPKGGDPVLIDLENISIGQPEWDLSVTATEWQVAGFWSDDQYQSFVDGYGFDVTTWPGFQVIKQAQAIKMTTWLMQNINESQEIRDEYELRMRTIRDGEPLRCWTPF